jgi:PAS domain S-box-containing protein
MHKEQQASKSDRILVVDDATANLQFLTNLLTTHGFTVHPASDGELALEFVRSILPDLILLDIRLPGMDGFEVCRRLKADGRTRSIPVIFISILEDEGDKLKGFQAGGVDYITKPFQPEEVLARVRTHLDLRKLTKQLNQEVRQRTEALEATNQQLLRELGERQRAEALLRESEEKYRGLIQRIQAAVVVHGPDTRILTSNLRAQQLLGLTEAQMMGKLAIDPDWHFLREDGTKMPLEEYPVSRVLTMGRPLRDIVAGVHRSTNMDDVWVLISGDPVVNEQGEVAQVIVTFVDITAHRKAQADLHRLNRQLRAISTCNQVLMQASNEQTLLDEICRIICEVAGYRMAWVGYRQDDEARTVRPVAWAGVEEGYLTKAGITWADTQRGQGPTGRAIQEGVSACIQDFASDPEAAPWRENALQRGYRSSIALPLKEDGAARFGALCIYSTEPNAFTPEEIRLLEELAHNLAFGIKTLRMQEDHQKAESQLLASEKRYRMVFEHSPVSIWEEDFSEVKAFLDDLKAQGVVEIQAYFDQHPETVQHCAALVRIVDVNRAALALHGAADKEALLAGLTQTFTPESFDTFRRELVCLWRGGTEMATDGVVKTLAGERRDVSAYFSVCTGHEQTLSKVIVSLVDITERKRNDAVNMARLHLIQYAEIHSLDDLLEETLNAVETLTGSLIGFYHFVAEDQKTLVLQNWSSRTQSDFCKAEGKGLHYPISDAGVWVDCVHQRKPVIHNDYASLPHRKGMPEGHAEVVRQLVVPVVRGEKITAVLGTGNKATDYNEKDVEIVSLMADFAWEIAERKRVEEELRQLNQQLEARVFDRTARLEAANKELEAFAYSVSHDLRAPLRHIDGFIELLQKRGGSDLDEKSRHYMDTISAAAQKMGLLIDELLSFSRMGRQAMSLKAVNLTSLANDVIEEFVPDTAGRDISFRVGDLPVVEGDESTLRLVLANLIANALKFTRPREKARIEIGSKPGPDADTVIYVRDNGVGFDMTYADKLFGVFQRLHRTDEFEGTGIGLATVRRIITRHGGRTWAEGALDQGAAFYFSLPQRSGRLINQPPPVNMRKKQERHH